MVLFSHPAVNAYTRSMVLALQEVGLLHSIVTTLGWSEDTIPSWLPHRLRSQLFRRSLPAALKGKIQMHAAREIMRLAAPCLGISWGSRHETGHFSVDAVYQSLDRFAARQMADGARNNVQAVYAGEDGALATFRAAQKRGLHRFYDLPIGYWKEAQRVYREENEAAPEFASTLTGLQDSEEKLERKEEELQLASVIVACSPFVKDSLLRHGVLESRIAVVPYGSPDSGQTPRTWTQKDYRRPLRVLFVGSLGQRKGIGYLLEAVKNLNRKDVELVLMGRFSGSPGPVLRYRDWFRLEPSRPHAAVLQLMKECDVLVLPSLFEGLAMVVPEAMSCGLPVIITRSTGADFLVSQGGQGFVVRERSVPDLMEKIAWFADHRDELPRMGQSAAATASAHSWSAHRQLFQRTVASQLNGVG